jgi:uncharacterized membrane protein YhfC
MNILVVTYALNGLLMIAMPVGLAIFLIRRWKLPGRIWWIGVLTFVFSQVGHIPFNALIAPVFNQFAFIALHPTVQLLIKAAFYGLSAGLFEEGARYLILRFWLKDARSWRTGILFGAGHGGAEAIIFGALVLFAYIQLLILRNATPAELAQVVSADQIPLAQAQLSAYWSAPWYATLLGAVERLFTIPTQIALAVIVMQVFTRKNIGWLFVAIGYHALLDAVSVFGQPNMSMYALEAIVGGFAILSLIIIFLLRQPEPVPAQNLEPASAPDQEFKLKPVEETEAKLDDTKYN